MKDRISITMLEDGIADVRLIRADKMNALDPAMWSALAEAVDDLKARQGPICSSFPKIPTLCGQPCKAPRIRLLRSPRHRESRPQAPRNTMPAPGQ